MALVRIDDLEELIAAKMTAFFMVTAVKASNLT
jgi:hypothetical protein